MLVNTTLTVRAELAKIEALYQTLKLGLPP